MIGLILKDFINLKGYVKQIGIMLAIFMVIGILIKSPFYLCFMIMMYSTMTIITTMAYDEKAGFDKFAVSMPISRTDLVKSKYMVWMINMGFALCVSMILGLVITILAKGNILEMVLSILAVDFVYLIIFAILVPIFFKFGVEKARIYILVIFAIPTTLFLVVRGILKKVGIQIPFDKIGLFIENNSYFLAVVVCFLVLMVIIISYISSIKIISKKEF